MSTNTDQEMIDASLQEEEEAKKQQTLVDLLIMVKSAQN